MDNKQPQSIPPTDIPAASSSSSSLQTGPGSSSPPQQDESTVAAAMRSRAGGVRDFIKTGVHIGKEPVNRALILFGETCLDLYREHKVCPPLLNQMLTQRYEASGGGGSSLIEVKQGFWSKWKHGPSVDLGLNLRLGSGEELPAQLAQIDGVIQATLNARPAFKPNQGDSISTGMATVFAITNMVIQTISRTDFGQDAANTKAKLYGRLVFFLSRVQGDSILKKEDTELDQNREVHRSLAMAIRAIKKHVQNYIKALIASAGRDLSGDLGSAASSLKTALNHFERALMLITNNGVAPQDLFTTSEKDRAAIEGVQSFDEISEGQVTQEFKSYVKSDADLRWLRSLKGIEFQQRYNRYQLSISSGVRDAFQQTQSPLSLPTSADRPALLDGTDIKESSSSSSSSLVSIRDSSPPVVAQRLSSAMMQGRPLLLSAEREPQARSLGEGLLRYINSFRFDRCGFFTEFLIENYFSKEGREPSVRALQELELFYKLITDFIQNYLLGKIDRDIIEYCSDTATLGSLGKAIFNDLLSETIGIGKNRFSFLVAQCQKIEDQAYVVAQHFPELERTQWFQNIAEFANEIAIAGTLIYNKVIPLLDRSFSRLSSAVIAQELEEVATKTHLVRNILQHIHGRELRYNPASAMIDFLALGYSQEVKRSQALQRRVTDFKQRPFDRILDVDHGPTHIAIESGSSLRVEVIQTSNLTIRDYFKLRFPKLGISIADIAHAESITTIADEVHITLVRDRQDRSSIKSFNLPKKLYDHIRAALSLEERPAVASSLSLVSVSAAGDRKEEGLGATTSAFGNSSVSGLSSSSSSFSSVASLPAERKLSRQRSEGKQASEQKELSSRKKTLAPKEIQTKFSALSSKRKQIADLFIEYFKQCIDKYKGKEPAQSALEKLFSRPLITLAEPQINMLLVIQLHINTANFDRENDVFIIDNPKNSAIKTQNQMFFALNLLSALDKAFDFLSKPMEVAECKLELDRLSTRIEFLVTHKVVHFPESGISPAWPGYREKVMAAYNECAAIIAELAEIPYQQRQLSATALSQSEQTGLSAAWGRLFATPSNQPFAGSASVSSSTLSVSTSLSSGSTSHLFRSGSIVSSALVLGANGQIQQPFADIDFDF